METSREEHAVEEGAAPGLDGTLASNAEDGNSSSAEEDRQDGGLPGLRARWKRRWTMVGLCAVAFLLCNLDRVNMSIAILPISEAYNLDSATQGLVQSSFFWGYIVTQILGGVWADKYGAKRVLGLGVVWWSLSTALTPLAAQLSLPLLLVVRAAMGVGEGVALPAMNNLLSKWVPVKERSRSLAIVYSGQYCGSIVGLALSPPMIALLGWPSVFYGFGALGLLWYLWWRGEAASAPGEDPRITRRELRYIRQNTAQQKQPGVGIPWRMLLSKMPVWALIIAHFCHNWGGFILLTWMPTYYSQVLGLDLKSSGFFSVLPWIAMAISANLAGWVADGMVERGVRVTTVRKFMQTIAFLGPAFFLTQLRNVHTTGYAVLCMCAAMALSAFCKAGLFSNHQDIGPRFAGLLLGMSNTAGTLAGMLGTAATGFMLQRPGGSWDEVWAVAVGFLLLGAVTWNMWATGEVVFP